MNNSKSAADKKNVIFSCDDVVIPEDDWSQTNQQLDEDDIEYDEFGIPYL